MSARHTDGVSGRQREEVHTVRVLQRPTRRTLILGGLAAGALSACSAGDTSSAGPSVTPTPSEPSPQSLSPSPGPSVSSPSPTPSATVAGPPSIALRPGPDIVHGPEDRGEVTLTFHGNGPAEITQGVMAALAAGGAVATIFAVGTWVRDDPSQVLALRDAGHEIGNHTFNHLSLTTLDAATVRTEIEQCREILASTLGDPGWWFRPSSTASSTEVIRAAANDVGYGPCVSYGVDPEDFRDPGPDAVRQRTLDGVTAGSIVSLHLGHAGTVTALPGILEGLSARGLRAVTLSTLLRD